MSPNKDSSSNAGTPGSRNGSSMLEDLSKTPSLPRPPSSQDAGMDDARQKPNGAPSKAEGLDTAGTPRELPQPSFKPETLSTTSSPSAAMAPSRAGTLSWQQRPSSRGSTGPRSRPLSMVASENNAAKSPRSGKEASPKDEESISRSQIAESLESKDPAWFKQTQERGLGSAAYRRSREEDVSDTTSRTGSIRLPGMSRQSTAEPEPRMSPQPDIHRAISPARDVSIRSDAGLGHRYSSSASRSSTSGFRSPLPTMSSQRFEPPSSDTSSSQGGDTSSTGRSLAMSPSQGRLSPDRMDRPTSPTKGLGGFVQSAMLKRSDSVNKRWSAQAGPGLSRGDSVVSNRSAYETSRYPMGEITPLSESRNSNSRETSPVTRSRPDSSHSNLTITQDLGGSQTLRTPTSLSSKISEISSNNSVRPTTPPQQVMSPPPTKSLESDQVMSPPSSPSKKWSPTKASWLENAINKPDSPKVLSPAPQQPAWMAEINRAKQNRGSVDLSKGTNFKTVSTGGLIRSPPPGSGYKAPTIGGLPGGFSAGVAMRPRTESTGDIGRTGSPETVKSSGNPRAPLDSAIQESTLTDNKVTPFANKSSTTSPPPTKKALGATILTSSTAAKSKPETPPKKDFKSTLKPQQTSGESKTADEPEFKNVFGKLKRTQTQNYKAPDELKDNIMRGKAGLAMTGGPKKTERKDDFKDSIMKKKEGMIAPSASTRITSASSKILDQPTPEAIAKRSGLGRSSSIMMNERLEAEKEVKKPEALAKLQHLRDKPKHILPEKQSNVPTRILPDSGPKADFGGNFASSLAGILQRGPSPVAGSGKPPVSSSPREEEGPLPSKTTEEPPSQGGPHLTHATKARAKGPKRRLPTTSKQSGGVEKAPTEPKPLESRPPEPTPQPKPQLTEKKPLSSSIHTKPQITPVSPNKPEPRPLANITNNNNKTRKTSQPDTPRKPSTSISQSFNSKLSPTPQSPIQEVPTKPSPLIKQKPTASPIVEKVRAPHPPTPQAASESTTSRASPQKPRQIADNVPAKQERESPATQEPLPSVRGAAALWGQPSKSPQATQPKSPVKLPTRKDEQVAIEEAGLTPRGLVGLGIQTAAKPSLERNKESPSAARAPPQAIQANSPSTLPTRKAEEAAIDKAVPVPKESSGPGIQTTLNGSKIMSERSVPSSPAKSSKSPPLPAKKPTSIAGRIASSGLPAPATSNSITPPLANLSEVKQLFTDIFDEPSSSKINIKIDTQAVVDHSSSNDSSQKIKTLRKQIFEITDHGKSIPVPSHQEHILFEDSLYLCTHVFGSSAGTRTTEVYLWCGDGVSSSAAEDAQLFARKMAKEHNGKLIILKQGKETSNFFQALGGIVITRRGSSSHSESSSSATYMLCGRQHVGQIAFDEVDLVPGSLCKGFPYIISARFGKLYLWKGTGAGADELGCARLIGMDLGLTGEIEEIDEGKEPDEFWTSFPEGKPIDIAETIGAQHWQLKRSCEKYATRLFSIDIETPRPKSSSGFMQWGRRGSAPSNDAKATSIAQIREINPFVSSDLVDDNIFVLDAFFEIFVYVFSTPFPVITSPSLPSPSFPFFCHPQIHHFH